MAAITSTIFGGVNGSISSINTIISWVDKLEIFIQQCMDAGETIRDIQTTAEARRIELHQWKAMWNIEVDTKYPFQRELWRDAQLRVIRGKIATIEDLCRKFHDRFEGFFRESNLSRLLQNAADKNASISSWQSQTAFRDDAKDNVKEASLLQIMGSVRNLKPQAIDWLSRLKTTLAELSEVANMTFTTKHREKVSDGLTSGQLEKLQRLTFLGMTVGQRQASEALFKLCLHAKERVSQENGAPNSDEAHTRLKIHLTGIKNGVDLESIPFQRGIKLLYHLVLEWETPPEELCIEGPLLDLDQAKITESFIQLYKAVLRNEEITILIELEPNVYFPSRRPHDNEIINRRNAESTASTTKSLAEIIHALDMTDPKQNMELFPRIQRLLLAFKVAECGLFLAGTSWLSNLRSKFIQRYSIDTSTYCFTLDAGKAIEEQSWNKFAMDMLRIGAFLSS